MQRTSQYLAVPDGMDKSVCSSDTSVYNPSRSQTPLLQHLYVTMTNWERAMASNAHDELNKIKHFPKLRKSKKGHQSQTFDYSDISSVDFSPKKKPGHESMKFLKNRKHKLPFTKSVSLHSIRQSSTSSEEDDFDVMPTIRLLGVETTSRPLSAPPGINILYRQHIKELF